MMGWQWHQLDHMQSFAPHSTQITTTVPHHSAFTGRMSFLPPNQQRRSTVYIYYIPHYWQRYHSYSRLSASFWQDK